MYIGADKGNQGILIFGSEELLSKTNTYRDAFYDGMFGEVPKIFGQLFTIHFIMNNNVIPVIYALLPNKMETTYRVLLRALKEIQVGLK